MKKLAIIGAGGINSWVIKHLKQVVNIFDKKELIYVKVFDKDVVEEKNLLRNNQNFKIKDLMQQKAQVLGERYGFNWENKFITEENINELEIFDDIILGVDNHKTRRLLYDYCLKHHKYLLDLRAQGTQIMYLILNHDKEMAFYDEKYFSNKAEMERAGSCQLQHDVETDHIENGNKIVAFFGIWGIYMKRLRGETPNAKDWKFAY